MNAQKTNVAQTPATLSAQETEALVQNLHTHQVELEMQNEALRQAHLKLDTERARYFDLYDLAPVGYLTLSETGLVLEANLTACILLGVNRQALVQQDFGRFILAEDGDIFYLLRKKILAYAAPQSCELRVGHPPRQALWLNLAVSVVLDESGRQVLRVAMSDISERKQAEALRKSEAFSVAVLNAVPDEIAVLDRQGFILAVNETWRTFSIVKSTEPAPPPASLSPCPLPPPLETAPQFWPCSAHGLSNLSLVRKSLGSAGSLH